MIFRNSLLLGIFSIISVLLGIVRDRLLAVFVGIGPVLDVYNASFRMPDLIYGLFLAFITAGTVIPFLTRKSKDDKTVESEKRFTTLLFFFSVMMIVLIIIIISTISLYAKLIVPGFGVSQLHDFIFATRLLMIQPLILGVSSLISCFAQLKNEFFYYAVSPLGYSLGIIGGVIFFYKDFGVNGLIFGVLIGALLSLLIQSITLRKHKISIKNCDFSFVYIKELVAFALPRSFTNIVSQLRVLFLTAFATTLGVGVLSSFLFAQKITDAINQVISQSITTASLPTLSREYEEGKIKEHERLVYKYTTILFLIAVCISFILYPLRGLVIEILYSSNGANSLIATFLIGFLIALPFSMASAYLAVGFYSMKNTSKVFIGNIFSSIVCVGVCLYYKDLGVISLIYGIVSHYSISSILYAIMYKRSHFLERSI